MTKAELVQILIEVDYEELIDALIEVFGEEGVRHLADTIIKDTNK